MRLPCALEPRVQELLPELERLYTTSTRIPSFPCRRRGRPAWRQIDFAAPDSMSRRESATPASWDSGDHHSRSLLSGHQ
jgi:hypothetical protein